MKKLFFLFLSFFLFQNLLFAQIDFPKLTGRVVDNANILNSSQKQNLTNILQKHEEQSSNQIVVVTLNSLEGYDIAEYGYQLGRNWGIGQKDKNNGVLLIVSMKDRKLRIEVGYGLEGKLTDKISHEIIEYNIKPEFKKGNYYEGILKGVNSIIKTIKGEYTSSKKSSNNDISLINYLMYYASTLPDNFIGIIGFIIFMFLPRIIRLIGFSFLYGFLASILALVLTKSFLIVIIVFILVTIFSFKKLKNVKSSSSSTSSSSSYGSSGFSSFNSGSSFSSDGFSSGGGSFGGGGASGSW